MTSEGTTIKTSSTPIVFEDGMPDVFSIRVEITYDWDQLSAEKQESLEFFGKSDENTIYIDRVFYFENAPYVDLSSVYFLGTLEYNGQSRRLVNTDGIENADVSVENQYATDAGVYPVKVTVTLNEGCKVWNTDLSYWTASTVGSRSVYTRTQNVEIKKAGLSYSLVEGGTPVIPSDSTTLYTPAELIRGAQYDITNTGSIPFDVSYTWSDGSSDGKILGAAYYDIKAVLTPKDEADRKNYGTQLTITVRVITATIDPYYLAEKVYTGSEQTLLWNYSFRFSNDGEDVYGADYDIKEIYYKKNNVRCDTIEAGSYDVYLEFKPLEEYESYEEHYCAIGEKFATITINKVTPTIRLINGYGDFVYGEEVAFPEAGTGYQVSNNFGNEVTFEWKDMQEAPKNVGEYTLIAKIEGDDNVNSVTEEFSIEVSPKPLTDEDLNLDIQIQNQDPKDVIFNHAPYTPKVVVTVTDNDSNPITLIENTDYTLSYEANVNRGTAKIKVSGTGIYGGTVEIF